jgi:hypothetical protein
LNVNINVTATLFTPRFKDYDMKTIVFDTDFNKKLHCDTFCHISMTPPAGTSVNLGNSVYMIQVKDKPDISVTAILLDTISCKLDDIREYFTQLSHNMSREFFQGWWRERYPDKTDMTIYLYKRIN